MFVIRGFEGHFDICGACVGTIDVKILPGSSVLFGIAESVWAGIHS